jgi:1-acyl-sn-glycerol-3-phosphate acyltransferase
MTEQRPENESGSGQLQIDLEKVIASKNPRLLRFMPGFLLRYIKRTIHQEDINRFLSENGHKKDFEFAEAALHELGVTIKWVGLENIPRSGGVIMASNHPLGGVDGMALINVVGKVRRDIHFLVNDILMNLKPLAGVFVPVNKHGKNSAEMVAKMDEVYASDHAVLIFPAGLVSRKQEGGVIKDLQWKKSFIGRARKYRKNVIPVYVDGRNSDFFYNLARFRKSIGIKANIEMFYLPDEMYRQKGKTITIIFGEPVSWETFDDSRSDAEWAAWMKERVYALGEAFTKGAKNEH